MLKRGTYFFFINPTFFPSLHQDTLRAVDRDPTGVVLVMLWVVEWVVTLVADHGEVFGLLLIVKMISPDATAAQVMMRDTRAALVVRRRMLMMLGLGIYFMCLDRGRGEKNRLGTAELISNLNICKQ